MPETLVLCGGVEAPRRYRGKLVELDLSPDAAKHRKVDFQSEQLCAGLLDDLPDIVADVLEIAVYVYSADRLVKRPTSVASSAIGAEWQRTLRFQIPVRCPEIWAKREINSLLIDTLSFLSGDNFEFDFSATKHAMALAPSLGFNDPRAQSFRPDQVMLFSGGLDSLAGAARDLVGTGSSTLLVTHQSANAVMDHQNRLARAMAERVGSKYIRYAPVRVRRGADTPIEHSQRLRSFLFSALGLAYARMFGLKTVRFYENGITSFNLPVAEHVLGTRASRTTHPRVLAGYSKLFSLLLDTEVRFENPFLWMTKTDILKTIVSRGCADLIPETTSCAAVRNYSMTRLQCGTCSQCVERRIAMFAAGIDEADQCYGRDMFLGPVEDARDLTMIAGHISRARNLARVSPASFVANHGQVLRALHGLEASPDKAFARIFELHRRYGREFEEAVNQRFAGCATIDQIRNVHPRSLLGMLLPGAESGAVRSDPAEREATVTEAPAAGPRIGTIVIALDVDKRNVLFADGPVLKKANYNLFLELVRKREGGGSQKSSTRDTGFILARTLASELGLEPAALRQKIMRLRTKLAKQFEDHTGYTLDDMDIIDSKRWNGYRLNPNVVVVAVHQLPAQRKMSRNPSQSVTEASHPH